MSLLTKRFINLCQEEVMYKNLNFEIFSYNNLNKVYAKTIKNALIMMIYIKFILNDYNYEMNLKSHIKKIIGGLTEVFINIIDTYVLKKLNMEIFEKNYSKREFFDKYSKMLKLHKIINSKGTKIDLTLQLGRNVESITTIMKQFSK